MAKTITNFNIDLSDMPAVGGTRVFSIRGDVGAIFSLEVKQEDGYYYNFTTGLFSATRSRLKQKAVGANGLYTGSIVFPEVTDNDQYDIYLFAEPAFDTVHAKYKEIRFGDGTLDINSSKGSNSSLLQKVIYQYTDTTITLYSTQQTLGGASVTWLDSNTTDTIVVGRGRNSGKRSFSMTVTTGTTEGLRVLRQPTVNDFFKELNVKLVRDGFVKVQGEDPWAEAASRSSGTTDGQTRGSSTLNLAGGADAVETTKITVDALPTGTKVGDRVTGHTIGGIQNCLNAAANRDTGIFLITALNPDGDNVNEFNVDPGITIPDGGTLYFNAPYYHRWKTSASDGGYGVLGLSTGLTESSGLSEPNPTVPKSDLTNNRGRPATIGPYEDSTTYTTETQNEDGSISEQTIEDINVSYPAIDTTSFDPTVVNGQVTKQDGIITFDVPYKSNGATETWVLVRGLEWVKTVHNTEIIVSNLKVALTKPTTTTTSAVNNSATIPVADREGTIQNISTISGIGIASGVANPTITSATADGAGSWTASAAQTLESGITLTVEGTSRTATITGDIEVIGCGDSNFSLIIEVPNFVAGA